MIGTPEARTEVYLSDFANLERDLLKKEPSWLLSLRRDAIQRFSHLGFPTRGDEAWRFTNLTPVTKVPFLTVDQGVRQVSPADLEALRFGEMACPRICFVDGFFSQELSRLESLPEGMRVRSLARTLDSEPEAIRAHFSRYASYKDHAFVALNSAFSRDGVVIEVSNGTFAETPVHILFVTTVDEVARRFHPRNLLVIGDNCEVQFLETYIGLGGNVYLANPVTEVSVGDNSFVDHYRVQQESRNAFHIGMNQVHIGRDSRYRSLAVDLGASIIRNDLTCVLEGEGGLAGLNGLYLLNGSQHIDNYTTLEHAAPHCDSRELFKGILDGKANGAFRGRIIVHKGAQKTDSKQTNQNLLLTDDAYVNTKPQLEIYADDVKCTHGATIGQLDATAMFYLRSRGIPEKAARSLLIYAFASELIERVKSDDLRQKLGDYLTQWLPRGDIVGEVYPT